MVFPVTVIGSVVVCLFFDSLGCANANGANSKQARRILVSFMAPPFLLSKLPERICRPTSGVSHSLVASRPSRATSLQHVASSPVNLVSFGTPWRCVVGADKKDV